MEATSPAPRRPLRLIVRALLLVVLVVLLGALAYDYLYARKQPSLLIDQLDAAQRGDGENRPNLTSEDVQKMIGFKPQETRRRGPRGREEVYIWTGGLLVTSHKLFVGYERNVDDQWIYESCRLGEDRPGG